MEITSLRQNADLSEDGIWIDFEDARVKIRSTDSKTYRRVITKIAQKQSSRKLQKDAEVMHKVSIEGMADGIVIDWEGFTENGVDLPCTRENRLKLCAIESFRTFVASEAQDIANFQREEVAAAAESFPAGD